MEPGNCHPLFESPNKAITNGALVAALSRRLQLERVSRGMTLEALAEASGLDPGFVASVERGERLISFTRLFQIAAVLGLPPSELVRLTERDLLE
ncbi:MAG TPA: helix-turn-helix transcriptional regulator [Candidatus Obscuribacterales bacterium]